MPLGLAVLAGAGLLVLWRRWRHRCVPVRQPHIGGFRCYCGKAGADLEELGFVDGGYVTPPKSELH